MYVKCFVKDEEFLDQLRKCYSSMNLLGLSVDQNGSG
jgi:hypothetical protein